MVKKIILIGILLLPALVFSQANELTEDEKNQGWELLFDGTMQSVRDNWTTYSKGNHTINQLPGHIKVGTSAGGDWFGKTAGGADIRTKVMWTNFEIKFEYRISENSGFFYRADVLTGAIFHNTVEYALLNNLGAINQYRTNSSGSIYDVYVPYHEIYHTWNTGEWNTARVIGRGDSIYHYHNDSLAGQFDGNGVEFKNIIRGDVPVPGTNHISKWAPTPCYTVEAATESACDHDNPYRKTGYFGFQTSYGGEQQYRGMKIIDLTSGCLDTAYFEYYSEFMSHDQVACKTPKIVSVKAGKNFSKFGKLTLNKERIQFDFSEMGKYEIRIIDVSGSLLTSIRIDNTESFKFQLPESQGLYFVKILKDGMEQLEKVMKY